MTNNLPFCPQLPVAGRFSDLPEAPYFASLAINSSLLKLMGRSPAHCKAAMDTEEKTDTEAQRLGRMIHCAALEPDRFGEAYCQTPAAEDFPEALTDLTSYKEKARELGLKVGGSKAELKARILDAAKDNVFWEDLLPKLVGERSPLKSEHWHMAQSILTSIAASPRASAALAGGVAEETLVWNDDATGMPLKARLDYYREDLGVVFDVKTTEDARPGAVERDIFKWGYHLSAAHYLEGLRALGLPGTNFAWIFIEKKPPFAIGLYFASPDLLRRGRMDIRDHTDRFAECHRSGSWPAYSDDFQTIDLPAWAQ